MMTTGSLEYDPLSTTDTDLSPPAPDKAERVRADVVSSWSMEHKNPTSRFFSPLHLTGAETYDIDLEPWRKFERAISVHAMLAHIGNTVPTDLAKRRTHPISFFTPSSEEVRKADRRRRYAKLSRLLDEWANDPSDFDDHVAPLIEEALREASPRHFPDE